MLQLLLLLMLLDLLKMQRCLKVRLLLWMQQLQLMLQQSQLLSLGQQQKTQWQQLACKKVRMLLSRRR
jgi:hypothetical protein